MKTAEQAIEQKADPSQKKLTAYELLLLVLSCYVLGALFAEAVFKISPATALLLQIGDSLICCVFLADFGYHFYRATNRWTFMKWGWIDLISSVPTLDVFRWGRVVRVVRILRLLRSVRSVKIILSILIRTGAKGTLTLVATVSGVLIVFSAIAILHVEKAPESNIKTPEDALWWAVVTITTVGYGDKFPITTEGRLIASVLMVAGVGLFGTFTAAVASLFLRKEPSSDPSRDAILEEVRRLREDIGRVEARLSEGGSSLPAQFGDTRLGSNKGTDL